MPELDRTALVVVDVQQAFTDAAYRGSRNNPTCEADIAALPAAWREAGRPVVFVRHDSDEPGSPLRPGAPGNAFKAVMSADELARATATSLHGEFATVV